MVVRLDLDLAGAGLDMLDIVVVQAEQRDQRNAHSDAIRNLRIRPVVAVPERLHLDLQGTEVGHLEQQRVWMQAKGK